VLILHGAALSSTTSGDPSDPANAGTHVQSGAQLQLPGNLSIGVEELRLSGTGVFDTGALLITGTASNSWAGNIILVGPGQAGIGVQGGQFTVPQPISSLGDGGLRKVGAGRLLLPGDNTYTGVTTVAGGSLEIRTAGGLGTSAGGTEVTSGATLVINPTPEANLTFLDEALSLLGGTLYNFRGNNTWTGDWTLQGNAAVIVEPSRQLTVTGDVADRPVPNPAGTLFKRGAGQLTLTGVGAYRGGTVIEQGVVRVDGNFSAANVLLNGATSNASLWGSGTVGAVTSGAGTNTVAPGANVAGDTTGILTSGPVTWSTGTSFHVNLNGLTPGTEYDRLVVNGDANLNNATLLGSVDVGVGVGDTFVILQTTGQVIGTFNGIGQNGFVFLSGQRFRVNYGTNAVTLIRE
jgi:autotransporter-associated beta strand protein